MSSSPARFARRAAVRAIFSLRWLLPVLAVPIARAQVPAAIINEIDYAPTDSTNPAEFIELHNPGDSALDLSGWKFDSGIDYVFPAGTALPAHGYLVISGQPAAFAARWGFTPLGPWAGKLSNDGERVRLRDAADAVADSVTYGAGFPWPTAARGEGSSMELINPALDNDLGGSWRSSGQPAGAGVAQVYVPINDVAWHYRKGTSEASAPTSAWRAPGFTEDATWFVGQTSVGFGDNDDNTIISDMAGAYTSLFLRRTFTIAPGAKPAALKLRARVDDGCIVWINGQEVARLHVPAALVPAYNSLADNHEADVVAFEEVTLAGAAAYLVEGDNVVAVQAFNSSVGSTDFTIDVSLEESLAGAATAPTPGAANSCAASNAPPAIRQVGHSPLQPAGGEAVTITAKITDPDGVASVSCAYQIVAPGAYVRKTDAFYATAWTSLPMYDDGTHGDAAAADGIYAALVPASVQTHRRLIRYRILATDTTARSITVPYADDGSPNFAYFVYDGVPAWSGAFKPGITAPVVYSPGLQASLPTYHLIANATDVTNSQYNSSYNGQRFLGTLVYNGVVHDHIQFNNRGEASTYVSGKNKWRFHFNTARDLDARDNWGRPYAETWDELNLNACASPWAAVHRGMAGVEEAVSLRLYELLGMASSKTHYLHFRVIDDASETGATQFQGGDPAGVNGGDLWGLYLAVEHPDGSFLDERGLADGNIYKIESSTGDQKHHGDGQPSDGSDWNAFLAASKATQTETWWRANLNLDAYYNFHAGNRIVGNIDLRQGFNHCFYHAPDGRWVVLPWDLDMMFIPKTHWSGLIDQNNCLSLPALQLEFKNRARELLDLLCADPGAAGGQIGQLIDEYAQMVKPAGASPSWADLDAAMWNMNPRTTSNSNAQTNHRGNFHVTPYFDSRIGGTWTRTLATADFAGSMKYLVDYATDTFPSGSTWTVNNGDQRGYGYRYLAAEAADATVPQRPTVTYLGASGHPINDLRFDCSGYVGTNAFAAIQWRVGELSAPGIPLHDPSKPRIYEVTDVWRSELRTGNTKDTITLPSSALQVGHTYRVRVRHLDATGRWSRWSEAVQFVPAAARVPITATDIAISEIMYNPPALSAAETGAGYTDKQLFEYIELLNISGRPLDLEGLAFTTGIAYTFPAILTLPVGERVLVAKNATALAARYGSTGLLSGRVAGEYSGSLDNSGERVVLSFDGQAVLDFSYSDGSHPVGSDPWPATPDGNGPSLVLINPASAPNHALPASWRASLASAGTPGGPDPINYAEWAARHPGLGAAGDDPDGDGRNNLAEYAFGTLPLVADHAPPQQAALETLVVGGAPAEPYFVFSCTRTAESGDLAFTPEFSTDLQTWSPGGVLLESTPNGNGTVTERWRSDQPAGAQTRLFARLHAQP